MLGGMRVIGRFLWGTLMVVFTIAFLTSLVRRRPFSRRIAAHPRLPGRDPEAYGIGNGWGTALLPRPGSVAARGRRRYAKRLPRYSVRRRSGKRTLR
jgi:hypothetical protein